MTEVAGWFSPEGHGTRLRENAEKRAAWEQERTERLEREQRQHKQAELEAHLQRRAALWSDTTGSAPSRSVLERWQQEYVDNKHAEKQAEREARIAASTEHLGF